MEQKLQKLFKQAKYQPESRLSGDIWRVINIRDRKISIIKSWSYGFAGLLSFAFLIPTINSLIEQFSQSGFYQYLSLVFSDLGSISLYWKEFMSSLVEAIPVTSLMLTFLLFFILLVSFKRAVFSYRSQLLTA